MQENFCSINYLTLCFILASVLQFFRTVLSVFCSFSLFFKFLCEESGRCFWLSGQCGCFVRKLLILVRTGVLVRSLMWHFVRTTLMFRPDGEPCRVKSLSPLHRTSLFSLLDFFLSGFASFFDFYA
jgi:hypothetical protein